MFGIGLTELAMLIVVAVAFLAFVYALVRVIRAAWKR